MNFLTQRIIRTGIGLCLFCHARIGIGEMIWSPEQVLRLPVVEDSMDLSQFLSNLHETSETKRSEWIFEALQAGYIPDFLRQLHSVDTSWNGHRLSFWVMSDYLSVGNNDEYLHVPINGRDALSLADSWNMYLPTRKMVDLIYQQASMVLPAEPLPIDKIKDPMKLWLQHEELMDRELQQLAVNSGWIQAGHLKDLVMSPRLINRSEHAAIYGWQGTEGDLLQTLASSISRDYEDYSMGVRLVAPYCLVDGQWMALADVLRNPALAPLISDEGAWDVDQVLKLDPLPSAPELETPGALLVHDRKHKKGDRT